MIGANRHILSSIEISTDCANVWFFCLFLEQYNLANKGFDWIKSAIHRLFGLVFDEKRKCPYQVLIRFGCILHVSNTSPTYYLHPHEIGRLFIMGKR